MPPPPPRADAPVTVDAALLRAWPLAGHDSPKAQRGTCLVVGGTASTPGAVALAATAALRAGAGKVQVATVRSAAAALAVALPEVLVVGLDEDEEGDLVPEGAAALHLNAEEASGVLVGPGCLGEASTAALLARVAALPSEAALVVDGHALAGLARSPRTGPGPQRPGAAHTQPGAKPGRWPASARRLWAPTSPRIWPRRTGPWSRSAVPTAGSPRPTGVPGASRVREPGCRSPAPATCWPGS